MSLTHFVENQLLIPMFIRCSQYCVNNIELSLFFLLYGLLYTTQTHTLELAIGWSDNGVDILYMCMFTCTPKY